MNSPTIVLSSKKPSASQWAALLNLLADDDPAVYQTVRKEILSLGPEAGDELRLRPWPRRPGVARVRHQRADPRDCGSERPSGRRGSQLRELLHARVWLGVGGRGGRAGGVGRLRRPVVAVDIIFSSQTL